MKKKKVLITGGLGFIGSYVIEQFEEEYDIFVIDNLYSNAIAQDSEIAKKCKSVAVADLTDDWNWPNELDLIIHLASPVGPVGILKFAGTMGKIITNHTEFVVNKALRYDCPLIDISTSEVYGYRETAEMLSEEDEKLLVGDYKVRNEYSTAKLLGEIIITNTAKVRPLKYHILRPFNISGARQQMTNGFVVPTFVEQAINNKPITVYGDGLQVRSFTHARDIAEVMYLLVNGDKININEIWNVGNGENTATILDIAERVKKLTKSKSEIIFIDPKTIHGPLYEEAWDKIADADKLYRNIGWKSTCSINEIILDVIDYWKNK